MERGRTGLGLALLAMTGCIYRDLDDRSPGWSTPQGAPGTVPPGVSVLEPVDPGEPVVEGGDYLETRIAELYARFGQGRSAISDLRRASLQTSETRDFAVDLQSGRCYTVIGAGTPEVNDLDLFLIDPAGAIVARDEEPDNFPVVSHCAARTGVFRVQAKMYAGSGEFALQLFGEGGGAAAPAPGRFPAPDPAGNPLERRMAEIYARFGQGRAPVSELMRGTLRASATQDFAVSLAVGRCYTVIGVSEERLDDLDLFLFDPNDRQLAQDRETDNFPVLQACAREGGRYRIRVEAYSGTGDFALQVFGE